MTAIDDLRTSTQNALEHLSEARNAIGHAWDEIDQQKGFSSGVLGFDANAGTLDTASVQCGQAFQRVETAWRIVGECAHAIESLRTKNEKSAILRALAERGNSLEAARQATAAADQALDQAVSAVRAAMDGGGQSDAQVHQAVNTAQELVSTAFGVLNLALEVNTDTQTQAN